MREPIRKFNAKKFNILKLALLPLLALSLTRCNLSAEKKDEIPTAPQAAPPAAPKVCTPIDGPDPILTAPSLSVSFASTQTVTATTGTSPYQFSIASGPSRIDATSGVFTAAGSGTTTVKVTDAKCRTATVSIAVGAPPAGTSPNDPFYVSNVLYHLTKMNLFDAWGIHHDSESILVGVIDTGIDYTHPDLVDNIDPSLGKNFVVPAGDPLENDPKDDNFHGTHVAGIIAARGNNSVGTVGINWKAKMIALKFLDEEGSGFTSDAVKAIDYARTAGARVLNNSWGGGGYSQSLKDAVDRALDSDILFVAAAGNDGVDIDTSPEYPASFDSSNVISVASTDSTDHLSWFSNYGVNTVPVAAPGSIIKSTFPTYVTAEMTTRSFPKDYHSISGTSMAAPQVAGLAVLLLSFDPTLSVGELKSRMKSGVDTLSALSGKVTTGGRMNAARVMDPGN